MEREVRIGDLQKLYGSNDMVKADCNGCQGCFACYCGMGASVILDPYDVWNLEVNLHTSFQGLLAHNVELNVADGLILPNLKMEGKEEKCGFLNPEGRCSIHEFRPGLCRLFPLGRYYEGEKFYYYLQSQECPKPNKTKVKVKRWLNLPDLARYETFTVRWHSFLKNVREHLKESRDEQLKKDLNMYMLNTFYMKPYDKKKDIYEQIERRLLEAEKLVQAIEW